MQLKFGLLADYVAPMPNGKILIVGEFDTINAPNVPLRGGFFLVGRFEAHVSEGTEHRLRIGLYDADGGQVGDSMPDLPLKFQAGAPGRPLRGQFIAQMMLEFTKFGDYEFHLNVDGRTEAVVPLYIVKARKPHGTA